MTREEYLDILQNNLHGIPPQEAENIMEYYREYFDDAGVENAEIFFSRHCFSSPVNILSILDLYAIHSFLYIASCSLPLSVI